MRVYLDNVIVSGRVRGDLRSDQMTAVQKLVAADKAGQINFVTSKETEREQNRTTDPAIRSKLQADRSNVPLVEKQDRLLSFHFQQDQLGGFVTYPLISDIVDEELFANLRKEGLEEADARHLMYAISNGCDRFITTDPHFIDRRERLKALCGSLIIQAPSELAAELNP
jgi:hypothetical protein